MQPLHILQLLSMYHPEGEKVLEKHAKVTQFDVFDEDKIITFLNNNKIDGIMLRAPAKITPAILDACEDVKAISGAGVGLDNIDVDYATKKRISILHAPKINTNATAEHAVSLILSVMKNIVDFNDHLKEGDFSYRDGRYTSELKGKKLGIVGFGSIAQRVAKIMKYGFDMDVKAYVRSIPQERQELADSMGVELTKDMDSIFQESDVISLHIPLTEKTDKVIDQNYLNMMKSDSVLINTARGGILDEEDLANAVKNRTIRGAGVDVFSNEPPASDHPFFGIDQITKTPHIGGISLEAATETSVTIATNLVKAMEGEKVETIVNHNEIQEKG